MFLALTIATSLAAAPPSRAAPVPHESLGLVVEHVQATVPQDVARYFNTILYVSKAAGGPWAQRMFVLQRGASGELAVVDQFPVSTGRERQEKYFTSTPTGIFTLDPHRMYRMHRSKTWDNAPMPYAMFLDVSYRDGDSGIALHAATGSGRGKLGSRASGGCVRMPPAKVQQLFEEIRAGVHHGMVPEFAWDITRGRTSTAGDVVRDYSGEPLLKPGISVLIVIENFSGRETLANALGRAPV
jgi:hypothetical protein